MSGFTAIVVARIEVLLDRPESTLRTSKKDKNSLNKKSILKYFFELFRKKRSKIFAFRETKIAINFFFKFSNALIYRKEAPLLLHLYAIAQEAFYDLYFYITKQQ